LTLYSGIGLILTKITVRLKPDTTKMTVRLKPDTTGITLLP